MFIIANKDDDMSKFKSFTFDEIREHLDDGCIIYDFETQEKYELNNKYIDIFTLINMSINMPIWDIIMKNNIRIEKNENIISITFYDIGSSGSRYSGFKPCNH